MTNIPSCCIVCSIQVLDKISSSGLADGVGLQAEVTGQTWHVMNCNEANTSHKCCIYLT